MASVARLYTPQVLALATGLAALPFDPGMGHAGNARSPSCGSTLALSLELDSQRRIARIGIRAQACAIGQAAAAIFAQSAVGRTAEQIAEAERALAAWLTSGSAPLPDWPGLSAIEAARAFPGRHGAIMLPWKAALEALPTA